MGYSEIAVILLVYSGLMTFFLVPFQRRVHSKNGQQNQVSFISVFKDSLIKMVFHKKAILALILLGFTFMNIWLGYASEESHYNAHSGYPPISTNLKAIYSICTCIYSCSFIASRIWEDIKDCKDDKLVRIEVKTFIQVKGTILEDQR